MNSYEYQLLQQKMKAKKQGQQPKAEKESVLQHECERILYINGIFYYHIRDAKREKSGVPDLLFLLHGRFCAVELKTKSGKVTKKQQETIRQIRANGGIAEVVRSVDDFMELIKKGASE